MKLLLSSGLFSCWLSHATRQGGICQFLYIPPRQDLGARALVGVVAAIYDVASDAEFLARIFHPALEELKVLEKISRRRCPRFDLDGIEIPSPIDEQIDLGPARLPIVKQIRLHAVVNDGLVDLRDDPAFEDSPAQRMKAKLLRGLDPQQVAGQPRVEEVQLARFDDLFADVGVPGRQPVYQIAGFQHGHPRAHGAVRDPGVAAYG